MQTEKKTKRASQSLAETVQQADLIIKGLKSNESEVAKRGANKAFVTEFEEDLAKLITQNAEQEKLKAATKMKTEEVNHSTAKVKKKISEAKKVIKIAIPQAKWIEFGISDKR